MGRISDRLKHAWNAFARPDLEFTQQFNHGAASYSVREQRTRMNFSSERSIISSIYTRLSMDVAAVAIRHVRLDKEDRFLEEMTSGLNDCLKIEANIDQAPTAFIQDVALTLFDRGVAAIVPVDTTINPQESASFDIKTMRVGEVTTWFPYHVRALLYNQEMGLREEITVGKRTTAIVENPLYSVMNEPNSTLQRIIRKLNLLDAVDEQSGSGKLDIIIQLPYVIKSEARQKQAEQRRKDLEFQLKGSQYGVAYTDGTEKITQLNRPVENNLLAQIQYLVAMLYGQLGLTEEVMNGTADEKAMINYRNRTINPIVNAIVEAMKRSFLTRTAITQKQSIMAFRDPFALVPMEQFADIADKLSRNEVVSPNELRQAIGMKPSKDPKADKLMNSNMPAPSEPVNPNREGDGQNDSS